MASIATSCVMPGEFYISNQASRPLRVDYTARCSPCLSPRFLANAFLRGSHQLADYEAKSVPAPVEIRGRADSAVAYSVLIPPDTALFLFERYLPGTGRSEDNYPKQALSDMRIKAETSTGTLDLDSSNVAMVLHRWHKGIFVVELP